MSGAAIITTCDAESVEPAASHDNSHVMSQLLPVMLDHLTYKDNDFNSDEDGSDDDGNGNDDDGDDDDGDGDDGDGAVNGVSQVAMVTSTTSVVLSTASLTSSLPEQTLSTTTNSFHSMTV